MLPDLDRLIADRRQLIRGGALAAAGLALPSRLFAAPLAGFTHGVASGEPAARSMLFWTRFVNPAGQSAPLLLELSTDPRFARIAHRAETIATPDSDWTAKATIQGLDPARTYYYRFTAADAGRPGRGRRSRVAETRSITGRTRTLPEGRAEQVRMAVFSCSNLPYGWFNAYAHAVADDRFDLALHLGDYLYEYARGKYPSAAETLPGRTIEPATEIVTLADYRARYASYRADPDLQALHARYPVIHTWDDHESANDAWVGGAENHDSPTQGPWAQRLAAARRARDEWMPTAGAAYSRYDIGTLATVLKLDTRVEGRQKPLEVAAALRGAANPAQALAQLRDREWAAGDRRLVSDAQDAWIGIVPPRQPRPRHGLAGPRPAGRHGRAQDPAEREPSGSRRPATRASSRASAAPSRSPTPAWAPTWTRGTATPPLAPASSRPRRTRTRASSPCPAIATTPGPTTSSAANARPASNSPATACPPGYEWAFPRVPPATIAQSLQAANPNLKFCDTARRGYMAVTLTPAAATCEYRFTAPVNARSTALVGTQALAARVGVNRLTLV
jgi:alkaline phosphatase D